MDARNPSADPARQHLVDRLRLEAQRRSTFHYVIEYLDIRARVLLRRAEEKNATDIVGLSPGAGDRDWIRHLFGIVTDPTDDAPGTTAISAVSDFCLRADYSSWRLGETRK